MIKITFVTPTDDGTDGRKDRQTDNYRDTHTFAMKIHKTKIF